MSDDVLTHELIHCCSMIILHGKTVLLELVTYGPASCSLELSSRVVTVGDR